MDKYIITKKDTREISKLITSVAGRQIGVSYEAQLWVQPEPNQPYDSILDTVQVSDLAGETYEEILDEDGCIDCMTYHYKNQLHDCHYVQIKREDGEWKIDKHY